jgi:hypothetical protein
MQVSTNSDFHYGSVQHERVWNRNYVWLLHNYEICVLGCKIILSPFYYLCKLHHSPTWTKHKQPQNHSKPKAFQNQNFNSNKLCIHTIILYKWKRFSRSQTLIYIPTKKKLIKKLPKVYPPHGLPCDSTINHKKTKSHGPPMWFHN